MADYVPPELETDAAALKERAIEILQTGIPGLVVQDGHPLNFILDANAEVQADQLLLLQASMDEGFASIGKNLLRTPQTAATYASGTITFTAVDTVGHTIPAGTAFTLTGLDGGRVGFETTVLATIPPGGSVAPAVPFIATEAGAAGSGLQAGAQLEDALAWISAISVDALTTGGEDEEDRDDYLNRLADTTQLLAQTLVIARDYEVDARNNQAGVARALALDGYNPGTATFNNAGYMTVAVVDEDGLDPGALIRDAGEAAQIELSVAQMTLEWIAATYTVITVVFAAKCEVEFSPADVETRAEAAVAAFLSPANWGVPPFGDQRDWRDKPVVRYRDVVAAIENVEGLDYTLAPTGTATTTSGNSNLTLVTPTTGWVNGMAISGAGIPAGTKILSGAGTATMVMANAAGTPVTATASAAGVAITGAAVTVNNGTADVTMTGPAALPSSASTVNGTVTAP